MTYSVIGILQQSDREIPMAEGVEKREAWSIFKSKIGAIGMSIVIRDTASHTVYGWDQWAGEWSA